MLCDETLKKSLECIFVGLPGCNWPFQYTHKKIYQNSFIGEIMDDKLSIMTMLLTWLDTSENKLQNVACLDEKPLKCTSKFISKD